MTIDELRTRLALGPVPLIIDVRSGFEFRAGHIPGAVHLPFWQAATAQLPPTPPGVDVVVYCGHGPRAQMAAAAFRQRGMTRVELLEGHWAGWKRAH